MDGLVKGALVIGGAGALIWFLTRKKGPDECERALASMPADRRPPAALAPSFDQVYLRHCRQASAAQRACFTNFDVPADDPQCGPVLMPMAMEMMAGMMTGMAPTQPPTQPIIDSLPMGPPPPITPTPPTQAPMGPSAIFSPEQAMPLVSGANPLPAAQPSVGHLGSYVTEF